MKIAIQGHPTRGNEVIQILESLGGKNGYDQLGSNERFVYFINNIGYIYSVTPQMCSNERKIYTLEEFETQFPFKVGDIVQTKPCGEPAEVINLYPNPACIIAYKVRYKSGVEMQYCPENIKFYKEMKEERNITLTLEKAKEWYKKGGELKEIALQAFTKKELNPLPRSWDEFCDNYPVKRSEAMIACDCTIVDCSEIEGKRDCEFKDVMPSKQSAEAHLAMMQLEQLRNCWCNGLEPDWNDYKQSKYCIVHSKEFKIHILYETRRFLSFPTKEMAEEFLECFRDLIEQARDLI